MADERVNPPRAPSARPSPEHLLDWPAQRGAVADVLAEMEARLQRRRQRRVRGAAIAAIALIVCGVAWQFPRATKIEAAPQLASSPVVVQPRQQRLPDGSLVELRDEARITVQFRPEVREVVLESGEAHFAVAKNPDRPFVVRAGRAEFRAVGTAFAVQLSDGAVEMVVTEGRVAVGTEATPVADARDFRKAAPNGRVAAAGDRVLVEYDAEGSSVVVNALSASALHQRLAWRAPRLELSATPLAEVLELIRRHSGGAVHVRLAEDDAALGKLKISGSLRADNIDTLIGVLEADYGIKAEQHGDAVVLHRRQ